MEQIMACLTKILKSRKKKLNKAVFALMKLL